jgi:hypothetical protein
MKLEAPHFRLDIFDANVLCIGRGTYTTHTHTHTSVEFCKILSMTTNTHTIILTDSLESIRNLVELVAVRHPHLKLLRQSLEERTVASLNPGHHGLSILVMKSRSHHPSKDVSEFLNKRHCRVSGNEESDACRLVDPLVSRTCIP